MPAAETVWPVPSYDESVQPHFLFIITPPYSGSTALCQLLNTSERSMLLDPRGEGQWLIPGLSKTDRWDSSKKVDYNSVRAVWLEKYQQTLRSNPAIDVVIEKSPPNMVRMEALSSLFDSCSFLANNRNPYANCASILYRHHDADNMEANMRLEFLGKQAHDWLMRSATIRDLISRLDVPLITYEKFCENPAAVLPLLRTPPGVAETINPEAEVQVKDYPSLTISDQNARQTAKLSSFEINHLTRIFTEQADLLAYFGYQTL
jgi:hypothetical protein